MVVGWGVTQGLWASHPLRGGLSVTCSLFSGAQTAKSNLEKAISEVAAASDEAAKAEAQIKVEANEALVKALE